MRRPLLLLTFSFLLPSPGNLTAQVRAEAKQEHWTPFNCKVSFMNDSIHLVKTSGQSGLLWLNNSEFKNGIIELDIKGKDVRGESFLGVAFHGLDNETYDAVYFRPFNFRDAERKSRSIQYIDKPGNDWDLLRKKYPGKYEGAINPAPDPNAWLHVKIVIKYPHVIVYVNGSTRPSLSIKQISKREHGKFALWIDSEDGWFKNVVITTTN